MFSKKHMGVIDWILFFFISSIPVLNLIVWMMVLLSKKSNPSLKNYVGANLIVIIIFLVLLAIGLVGFGFSLDLINDLF